MTTIAHGMSTTRRTTYSLAALAALAIVAVPATSALLDDDDAARVAERSATVSPVGAVEDDPLFTRFAESDAGSTRSPIADVEAGSLEDDPLFVRFGR